MDLSVIEIAQRYGALDDTAAGAGDFVHAHVLRELARQSHRLVQRGEYLTHQVWNVDGTDAEAPGVMIFSASPSWSRVLGPIPVMRKPHLRTARMYLRARITVDTVVLVQIVTRAHAFRADLRSSTASPNVIALAGTGDWEDYIATGIALGSDDIEVIEVWATADATSNHMDTATYGSPNNGTPDFITQGELRLTGATWDMTALNAAYGAVTVQLLNGDGVVFAPPRPFVCAGTELLRIGNPALYWTPDEVRAGNNPAATFELLEVPSVRMAAFKLREQDGY